MRNQRNPYPIPQHANEGEPWAKDAVQRTKKWREEAEAKKTKKAKSPTAPAIIVREVLPTQTYIYQVRKTTNESYGSKPWVIEVAVDRPEPTWDYAFLGNYSTKANALRGFGARYQRGNHSWDVLEVFDPTVRLGIEKQQRIEEIESQHAERDRAAQRQRDQEVGELRERINREFATAKFKATSTTIRTAEGNEIRVAKGPGIRGLIVIPNESKGKWKRWIITHQRSGKAIGPDFKSLLEAKVAAFRMSQLMDWDKDADVAIEEAKRSGVVPMLPYISRDPWGEVPKFNPKKPRKGKSRGNPTDVLGRPYSHPKHQREPSLFHGDLEAPIRYGGILLTRGAAARDLRARGVGEQQIDSFLLDAKVVKDTKGEQVYRGLREVPPEVRRAALGRNPGTKAGSRGRIRYIRPGQTTLQQAFTRDAKIAQEVVTSRGVQREWNVYECLGCGATASSKFRFGERPGSVKPRIAAWLKEHRGHPMDQYREIKYWEGTERNPSKRRQRKPSTLKKVGDQFGGAVVIGAGFAAGALAFDRVAESTGLKGKGQGVQLNPSNKGRGTRPFTLAYDVDARSATDTSKKKRIPSGTEVEIIERFEPTATGNRVVEFLIVGTEKRYRALASNIVPVGSATARRIARPVANPSKGNGRCPTCGGTITKVESNPGYCSSCNSRLSID